MALTSGDGSDDGYRIVGRFLSHFTKIHASPLLNSYFLASRWTLAIQNFGVHAALKAFAKLTWFVGTGNSVGKLDA